MSDLATRTLRAALMDQMATLTVAHGILRQPVVVEVPTGVHAEHIRECECELACIFKLTEQRFNELSKVAA